MSSEMLTLLSGLGSPEHKEKFLEGMSALGNEVSKRIIAKAASPHSPVAIDEFPDVSETTMSRYCQLLQGVGVVTPVWEDNKKKFAITPLGREIAKILENNG